MENELMVILPQEVEQLAKNVSIEKRNEVQNVLNHVFNGVAKMRNQLESVTVSDEFDKVNMKLANTIRLGVRQVRLDAEKQFDAKRAKVQQAMLSFKTEDALWLKAKQTMQILTKEIEENARWKEETKERIEKERFEIKIQDRILKVQKFNTEIQRQDVEYLSDASFDVFLSGVEKQYNDKIEAEAKDEAERLAAIEADRLERERIKAENERLQKEAAEKAKQLEAERKEQQRILAIEREKAEAERKELELKARKEREIADAKLKAEREIARIAAEKAAAEKAKLEAEIKAKADAERKIKEAKEAEIKARLKAEAEAKKAPKQKRLNQWIDGLSIVAPSGMESDAVIIDIFKKFESFKEWARVLVNQY